MYWSPLLLVMFELRPPVSASQDIFSIYFHEKKTITKSKWWNVISSELIGNTAATSTCAFLQVIDLNRKASEWWTYIIHVNRNMDGRQILCLNAMIFSILVYDSNTNSPLKALSAASVWSRNFKQHCQTTWDLTSKQRGIVFLCSVFRKPTLELDKKGKTSLLFTYQMNTNKKSGLRIREGAYIDCGKKNDDPHVQSVAGWGKSRGEGSCSIVAFRHVWRPKKGETSELSWKGGGLQSPSRALWSWSD